MKGTVSFAGDKDFGDKKLYSFRLVGDERYFNCGTFNPDVKKGELVEFEGEDKGGNKFQVNVRSVKVLKEAGAEVVTGRTGGFRAKFQKDPGKDEYWKKREERDIEVQQVIQLQSARNSAIALADIMLKNGIIDWEKVKITKRRETIELLVRELTETFQKESATLAIPVTEETPEGEVVAAEGPNDDWE